jgi:hypothetical protein
MIAENSNNIGQQLIFSPIGECKRATSRDIQENSFLYCILGDRDNKLVDFDRLGNGVDRKLTLNALREYLIKDLPIEVIGTMTFME